MLAKSICIWLHSCHANRKSIGIFIWNHRNEILIKSKLKREEEREMVALQTFRFKFLVLHSFGLDVTRIALKLISNTMQVKFQCTSRIDMSHKLTHSVVIRNRIIVCPQNVATFTTFHCLVFVFSFSLFHSFHLLNKKEEKYRVDVTVGKSEIHKDWKTKFYFSSWIYKFADISQVATNSIRYFFYRQLHNFSFSSFNLNRGKCSMLRPNFIVKSLKLKLNSQSVVAHLLNKYYSI